MSLDPVLIPLIALCVALAAFLFGPAVIPRLYAYLKGKRHRRVASQREVGKYLTDAASFFNGLPWFIRRTWGWGPSVPNYSANGSFPDQASRVVPESLRAVVSEGLEYYARHGRAQGQAYHTLEEGLRQLHGIELRFWVEVKAACRLTWPLSWRRRLKSLKSLQLSSSERERIFRLRSPSRDATGGSHGRLE